MGMIQEFDYFKCKSIDDVLEHMILFKSATILAGGTDLVANLKEDRISTEVLLDIKGIKKLKLIKSKGKYLEFGSLVTFSDLISSDLIKKDFPTLLEMAKTVASKAIRNRATVVGNICSAVPCMDSAPLLLSYDAIVVVTGLSGEREIPLQKWFKGPKRTAISKNEFVTSIKIPKLKERHSGCFLKLGRYLGEDLAQANIAILNYEKSGIRVSFGSVGPVPIRALNIEKLLNNSIMNEELIDKCIKLVEETITPITDIRATKEYRTHMCKVMFKRALKTSIERLSGSGPKYGEYHL